MATWTLKVTLKISSGFMSTHLHKFLDQISLWCMTMHIHPQLRRPEHTWPWETFGYCHGLHDQQTSVPSSMHGTCLRVVCYRTWLECWQQRDLVKFQWNSLPQENKHNFIDSMKNHCHKLLNNKQGQNLY